MVILALTGSKQANTEESPARIITAMGFSIEIL